MDSTLLRIIQLKREKELSAFQEGHSGISVCSSDNLNQRIGTILYRRNGKKTNRIGSSADSLAHTENGETDALSDGEVQSPENLKKNDIENKIYS